MPENEQQTQNEFMIEKIKERPVNKKKLIQRTILTASMAVIFGLIACFTFLVLEPVISNWLYPEEKPNPVVFPEDQEEMSPEEMLSDIMQTEKENQQPSTQEADPTDTAVLEEEQVQQILDRVVLDKQNYLELYAVLAEVRKEAECCIATVTGVSSNLDWFNNVEESKNQSSGLVIAENGKELLILVDFTPIRKSEELTVTLYNGLQFPAHVKETDSFTGLAVVAVEMELVLQNMLKEEIAIATLGSSNMGNIVGSPVVAVGSPMGVTGSVGYGMITAQYAQAAGADTNYKFLQTDIFGSTSAGGVLVNLQGNVVGIITNSRNSSDTKNLVTAFGISELKKRVEKMSNGEKAAYLGIKGMDVTRQANEEQGVPYGVFIKNVDMDSPVMRAGIQKGDILTAIGDRSITGYNDYTSYLMQLNAGEEVELKIMRQAQNEYKEMIFRVVPDEAK